MIHVPLGQGGTLVEAQFVARPNRFLVEAMLNGQPVFAHLADRGRLTGTLIPGARLLLASRPGPGRKTNWQAVAAVVPANPEQHQLERLVSLDTVLPNRLVEAALTAAALDPFRTYTQIRREAQRGASRFDFALQHNEHICTVEVKSAGHLIGQQALFPDAPTSRGRRHLEELASLVETGERAAVVFIAQGAVSAVVMNQTVDPEFASTLRQVRERGVEVYAYACPFTIAGLELGPAVPVL